MQDRTHHEYHLWVRLRMTPEERRAYRTEHAMSDGEPTRDRLTASVAVELDGLGTGSGWWHDVHVT